MLGRAPRWEGALPAPQLLEGKALCAWEGVGNIFRVLFQGITPGLECAAGCCVTAAQVAVGPWGSRDLQPFVFQDTQEKDKAIPPERAEEAKLKAKYPNLGQKPGGSDFLMKRLQKGVCECPSVGQATGISPELPLLPEPALPLYPPSRSHSVPTAWPETWEKPLGSLPGMLQS